jgi:hypothetical protein
MEKPCVSRLLQINILFYLKFDTNIKYFLKILEFFY